MTFTLAGSRRVPRRELSARRGARRSSLFVLAESLTAAPRGPYEPRPARSLTALAFALAGIFYGFITYIGRFDDVPERGPRAIVFLVLFEPLEHETRTRVNKFFFRERYDLESSVGELRRRSAQ